MHLILGIALILGMMALIFLGPEWVLALTREFQDVRKAGQPH